LSVTSGSLDLQRGQAIVGARFAEMVLFDPETRDLRHSSPSSSSSAPPSELQDVVMRLRLIRYTDEGTPIEKTVRVQIVGVLEPSGWQHDTMMYMPLRDVLEFNTWINSKRRDPGRQGYSKIVVHAENIEHTITLEGTLREMGFEPFSQRQEAESANAYFATVQAVLGGIGGVALLVAAFGIANTMLMAIYERTREIGLMKAVGATHRDVMMVFLAEAGGIGLIGGVGGVALGMLVSGVINLIASIVKAEQVAGGASPGLEMGFSYTPLWLPCFATVFAVVVGVASGAYPANRAANLEPLHALKYE
jgi:putative ABC transport system permease protein